ncbi:hypothetical protein I4X03_007865 [Massilia sp. R798]|uniref:Uncharacterized protein n=1 Tax=Massilia soli TaxID=2792854 RepID=A0ABS7SLX0_9BURK|nr:hypothetical protein [Massilia soli]
MTADAKQLGGIQAVLEKAVLGQLANRLAHRVGGGVGDSDFGLVPVAMFQEHGAVFHATG